MMISTKGRYALRILVDLAEHETGAYIPLKEIAARQGISEKYLESILKILVKNQLLQGLRGKGGGYRFLKRPEEITAGDVLRLTEGTLAPVSCLEDGARQCPRRAQCRTLPIWRELDEVIARYLDGVTVADMTRPSETGKDEVI